MSKSYVWPLTIVCLGLMAFFGLDRFPGFAASAPVSSEQASEINLQIDTIQEQIQAARLKLSHQEIDAQNLFFTEWGLYAKKMQEIEHQRLELDALKKQLEDLKAQKKILLEQQIPPQK